MDEPRYILSHLTDDYRELSPDPKYNWCCGGGGGLVAMGDDSLDFRMKSSKVKVDQMKETNADIMATACENCHTQLSNLNDHYKVGMEVKFLSSLMVDALVQ
jgi:Fe-S oxidoreductase